jgi:16S rRNA (adenine1518-N6/adenine1519-N6)-dimethyltransferase
MSSPKPKKELGQHWLRDIKTLDAIVDAAQVQAGDTVLEIGPGLGTLTARLLKKGATVIAVEFDRVLAAALHTSLTKQLGADATSKLTVVESDILTFDFTKLPNGYKVVANIPYYLTSHLIRILGESTNSPDIAAMLVQKEVAERVCAAPGDMSLLSVSAQVFFKASLGIFVPAELFTPPPKVDSQVLLLEKRDEPVVAYDQQKGFFRLVKAGFGERRKMLRSSLSGGLHITKPEADALLASTGISGELRAQALSMEDWQKLFVGVNNSIKH